MQLVIAICLSGSNLIIKCYVNKVVADKNSAEYTHNMYRISTQVVEALQKTEVS